MLEEYVKSHNENTSIVSKFSATELEHLPLLSYSDELLQAIGDTVGKEPSVVLYELLVRKHPKEVVKISSREDLQEAILKQQPYIFIPAEIRQAEKRLVNSVLSEKDTLGVELGSAGTVNILAEIIYQFQLLLNKESKEFNRLKSKLRRYHVRLADEGGHLIYEKEQLY